MKKTGKYYELLILAISFLIGLLLSSFSLYYFTEIFFERITDFWLSEQETLKLKLIGFEILTNILVFYVIFKSFLDWQPQIKKLNFHLNKVVFLLQIIITITLLNFISSLNYSFLYNKDVKYLYLYTLYKNSYIYILTIVAALITIMYKKNREIKKENLSLKEHKIKSELLALKEQISPHFFFNTLSSLSAIVRTKDKEDTLEFIENLSMTYRYIMQSNTLDMVKVSEELEFIKAYFYILKKRYDDRIQLKIELSTKVTEFSLPPLAMQICVENATIHNVFTREDPLIIKIYEKNESIIIRNNLRKKDGSENMGTGLSNLNKRYKLLTEKELSILKDEENFTVKLPVVE